MSENKCYNWIVSLRAFAASAIVLLHVIAGWTSEFSAGGGITGARWFIDCVIIQVFVRWAVPCFVMITGFLLLDPEKNIDLKKTFRYVLRMIAVLLTFGLLYCLMESAAADGFGNIPATVIKSVKNLIEGHSWSHMWYVYMLIGLYLMLPMFRIFTKYADKKTYEFILAVLLCLTILRPTANEILKTELEAYIPISTAFPFYLLLGQYIHRYGIKKELSVLGIILGAVGTAVEQVFALGNQPDNLFVALYSVGIFSLAMNNSFLEKAGKSKFIVQISKYSFGIYLIHPLFLNILNKALGIFPDILPTGIGEAAFYIAAFSGAFALSWLLGKVPLVREIL